MKFNQLTSYLLKKPLKATVVSFLSRLTDESNKYLFEKKYGLDFGGHVPKKKLVADSAFSLAHATAYQPYRILKSRIIINKALKFGMQFNNFVDIGSGTGKVCIYTAKKYRFKKIIGIDFSGPLVEMASKNLQKLNLPQITIMQADAAEYNLPDGKNLIFLFNPFDGVIFEKFLTNNLKHFENNQSILAYANDLQRDLITSFGFESIFRDKILEYSLFRYKH
jgi:SAM-dependent methyltransferase